MDFYKLIQSLDELLYEVLSWLLFYPITVWRVLTRPVRTMLSVESELAESEEMQFDDIVGPPLFLFLSLLLIHAVELGAGTGDELIKSSSGLSRFITSDSNLIEFRAIMFGLLPLTAARRLVKARGGHLDKQNLRAPFYAQCYAAALYALVFNLILTIGASWLKAKPHYWLPLMLLTNIWLLAVETAWFRRELGCSLVRGFGQALLMFVQWCALLLLFGFFFR